MYNFDPYNVLLAIATNIPVLLMTAFVAAGTHIYIYIYHLVYQPTKGKSLMTSSSSSSSSRNTNTDGSDEFWHVSNQSDDMNISGDD